MPSLTVDPASITLLKPATIRPRDFSRSFTFTFKLINCLILVYHSWKQSNSAAGRRQHQYSTSDDIQTLNLRHILTCFQTLCPQSKVKCPLLTCQQTKPQLLICLHTATELWNHLIVSTKRSQQKSYILLFFRYINGKRAGYYRSQCVVQRSLKTRCINWGQCKTIKGRLRSKCICGADFISTCSSDVRAPVKNQALLENIPLERSKRKHVRFIKCSHTGLDLLSSRGINQRKYHRFGKKISVPFSTFIQHRPPQC